VRRPVGGRETLGAKCSEANQGEAMSGGLRAVRLRLAPFAAIDRCRRLLPR